MQSLVILGRQPALGLAELESLYGSECIRPIGRQAAILAIDPADIDFDRLGGSIKLARILHTLPTTSWHDIESYLTGAILTYIESTQNGKLKLGLSVYGLRVRAGDINATGLQLKKIIKASGRSVRVVPNKSAELNSAQVLHNQLTSPAGIEIVIARDGNKTIIARTIREQDIEAYAKRDQARPMRDAKVGMLPPKLAQIIINLSAKPSAPESNRPQTILDPFCGTGVVLQEALLMGHRVHGSDLEPRMIEYSRKNINWLHKNHDYIGTLLTLQQGDATTHQWPDAPSIDSVACETYLGKPLSSLPPRQILDGIIAECDEIHEKFLRNIGAQLSPGTRLCLAVPAWKTKNGFLHLKTLDLLEKLGYTHIQFVHVRNEELIYHRPDQTVARELVILEKR